MPRQDYGYNPNIELFFHTRRGLRFATAALLQYQSTRTMENPAAQATLTFRGLEWQDTTLPSLHGKSIDDTFDLYDQCQVRIRDEKGSPWLDINGLITDIFSGWGEVKGKPEKLTRLTLVGLGHILQTTSLFFHPHIAGKANIAGIGWLIRARGNPPSGRPDQILKQVFDVFVSEEYKFKLPDGRSLREAIGTSFVPIRDGLALLALNALGMEENLWGIMKRFSDAPFNSLWVDIPQRLNQDITQRYKGEVSTFNVEVNLEPTPFDFPTWDKLARKGSDRYFTYEDEELMGAGEQLKRSSEGIATMFWCAGKGVHSSFDQLSLLFDQSGGQLPIYFEDSISQLGLRRLEQSTEYVQYFKEEHEARGIISAEERQSMHTKYPDRSALLLRRSMQMAQWYGWPHGFYTGTITTRGRVGWSVEDGARVGSVLKRRRDGMESFVTGISQQWTHPGPFTTTWTVERGANQTKYREWWAGKIMEFAKARGIALDIAKDLLGAYGIQLPL